MINLIHGDCLEEMANIPDGSIDAIITDPPYGTTACKWDSVIPFEPMWAQLKRVIKPNGAIVLFGIEPFSSALRMSNTKMYKYDWVWDKNFCADFYASKHRPMTRTELISVFTLGTVSQGGKNPSPYYPVMTPREKPRKYKDAYGKNRKNPKSDCLKDGQIYCGNITHRYPNNIIKIGNSVQKGKVHPTQKPVALMEYLTKTYTNEGETVLDFTMGSGTTGVACVNLDRSFIGIEQDEKYFEIAENRINEAFDW